jgi:hypothetical protein
VGKQNSSEDLVLTSPRRDVVQLAYTWRSKLNIYGALGRAFLWSSDELSAQIAFQQEIELQGGVFVFAGIQCDGCHLPISCAMKRVVCKHYLEIDLCGQCFRSHETDDKAIPSCANHCFLKAAPDELSESVEVASFDEARRAPWLRDLLTT